MQKNILKPSDFETSLWAGGSTTQLFIYPPNSDYSKRDFSFRLSSAKVDLEESEFTALPGVFRKLLILDGEITIIHENQYSKKLSKFDQDQFEGDWKTSSRGKCTDFNLMCRGKARGDIQAFAFQKKQERHYVNEKSWDFLFLYLHKGEVLVEIQEENPALRQGELLVIRDFSATIIQLKSIVPSDVIICLVSK